MIPLFKNIVHKFLCLIPTIWKFIKIDTQGTAWLTVQGMTDYELNAKKEVLDSSAYKFFWYPTDTHLYPPTLPMRLFQGP